MNLSYIVNLEEEKISYNKLTTQVAGKKDKDCGN